MFKTKWFKKLCKIASSTEFAISVYPSGGLASMNTWIAHHSSNVPLYGLIIIFLVTASYTIAAINWFTDLYRKKTLKHRVILQQLSINQFLLCPEKRAKRIRLGLHVINNSDIPIFHNIEIGSYHLSGVVNSKMQNSRDIDVISPKCISHMSLPSIEISDDNKQRLGNLKLILSYGKRADDLRYKIDVDMDIGLIFLENGQLICEQNIKKFEYI